MTTAQKRVDCVACKRVRFGDSPPLKRVALGNIAVIIIIIIPFYMLCESMTMQHGRDFSLAV